ncbi:MAG: MFS transporter [Syntrophorhabdaceae bacterium]|nr:MFS transporter [Syntrophorhabdaceae bacterium]
MTTRGPAIFTREFVLLNIVLGCASATMALFFQFHTYLLSLNIDPRWHGFLLGADAITGIILQPLLSPYLHTGNAKKVAAAGMSIMIAALGLYNFATTTTSIACVRVVHGGGFTVLVAAMMTLFAAYIPSRKSGEAIGLISITRLIPYAVIPPVVVYLVGRSYGFISIVTVAAGCMTLFLIPLAFIRSVPDSGQDSGRAMGLGSLVENVKAVPVRMLLAVNLVFYSAYTTLFYFLKDFGTEKGIKNPGFFFTVAMIAMIVVRLAGSRYFDRMKKARAAAVCMAILAVCHVLVVFVRDSAVFLALGAGFGVLWGVGIPLMMALLFDVSEARFRGLNMNLSLVMMQGGFFAGPLAGGFILAQWGYGILFLFCGLLNAAGVVLLTALPRSRGNSN